MELTKQQAIEGHRKMWNWIADKIEREKTICNIPDLKKIYCRENNLFLRRHCFCCEYKDDTDWRCDTCPVDWIKTKHCCDNEKSLYSLVIDAFIWQEQAELARQIANLPEKIDVEEED